MYNLLKNMGINLYFEKGKIIDLLNNIPRLGIELEISRRSGDLKQISTLERRIADKIQMKVSRLLYQLKASNLPEIMGNEYINSINTSIIGGALMKKVGLNYLVVSMPRYSTFLLVTSDGQVEWRDMTIHPLSNANKLLTNEMIKGQKKDGRPLTIADIVAFSQKPTPEGLKFDIYSDKYHNQSQHVVVFDPEYGQQIQVLCSLGDTLYLTKRFKKAAEVYRKAIAINPKSAFLYHDLGDTLFSLERFEEAAEIYRKAIAIDPESAFLYHDLGNALFFLDRFEEAAEVYRKAIAIDRESAPTYYNLGNTLYFLGHFKGAIEAYQKFIELAEKREESNGIEEAKRMILIISELISKLEKLKDDNKG